MIEKFNIHTDLAVENKERFQGDDVEISGVKVYERFDDRYEVNVTKVEIVSPEGANIMGKPIGKYVTIDAKDIKDRLFDSKRKRQLGKVLARELYYMMPVDKKEDIKELSVLVVGLGNKEVTPDSLGPYVIANLEVTRHIFMLKNNYGKNRGISAMIPGVMAQSGMESAEMIEGIVSQIKPDVVICIDALAAGSTKRLNSTIQLSDTGINTDEEICRGLATAGIIGNLTKRNASISGAEAGCQAEIGTACSMAAAALAELYKQDLDQVEYAAEVAMEHHLGLTCDPICGLVQIPCIERNAVAAMRAMNACNLSYFLTGSRNISYDMVCRAMHETGINLNHRFRETGEGGLAKLYNRKRK